MDKHREQRLMELLQTPSPDEFSPTGSEAEAERVETSLVEKPLDPLLKQRLIDAVLALPPAAAAATPQAVRAPQVPAPIIALAGYRSRKKVYLFAGAVAAAACAVLVLRPLFLAPVGVVEMRLTPTRSTLGGPVQVAPPTEPVHYLRTALLKVDVSAVDTTREALVVDSYIGRPGEPLVSWIRPKRVHDNHFELRYRIDELPKLKEGGEWELVMILGRPGRMPTVAEAEAALQGQGGSRHWTLNHQRVVIEDL